MLTESEIKRYSRQILLKPVGGRGQEKLNRGHWEVQGDHPLLQVASAYLLASGVQVRMPQALSAAPGFLHAATPQALNADLPAPPQGLTEGVLTVLAPSVPVEALQGHRVVIASGAIAWATAPFQVTALAAQVGQLSQDAISSDQWVHLGSAAALIAQRIVLGLETGAGTLHFKRS